VAVDLVLDVTGLFETLPKRGQELHVNISRSCADETNDRQRPLLRMYSERPACRHAAK
jgi:hypothetical protein